MTNSQSIRQSKSALDQDHILKLLNSQEYVKQMKGLLLAEASGHPLLISAVVGKLDSDDFCIRLQARQTLFGLGAKEYLREIVENLLLWPQDPILAEDLQNLISPEFLTIWPPTLHLPQVLDLRPALTPERSRYWLEQLSSAVPVIRYNALRVLAQARLAESVPEILNRLEDPIIEVRLEAIQAAHQLLLVRHLSLDRLISHMLPLTQDISPEIRIAALDELGMLTKPEFPFWDEDELQELLQNSQEAVSRSDELLSRKPHLQAILTSALRDASFSVRLKALQYVVPADESSARHALAEWLLPEKTNNEMLEMSWMLREQLQAWPESLHAVVSELLRTECPPRQSADGL